MQSYCFQPFHLALILFSNSQSTGIQFSPGVSGGGGCMQGVQGAQTGLFLWMAIITKCYVCSCSALQKSCFCFLRAGCPGLPQPPSSHAKWHHLHDIQHSDFLVYNFFLSYTAKEIYHTPFPVLVTTRWRLVLTYSQPSAPQSTWSKEATWTLQSNMRGELKMFNCVCSSADCMREM